MIIKVRSFEKLGSVWFLRVRSLFIVDTITCQKFIAFLALYTFHFFIPSYLCQESLTNSNSALPPTFCFLDYHFLIS